MITYLAYKIVKDVYNSPHYDELWDDFYYYIVSYRRCKWGLDVTMAADCIENLIGIREHKDIVKEIFKRGYSLRFKK